MKNIIDFIKRNYCFYILIGLTLAFHFVSSEAFLVGVLAFFIFFLFFELFVSEKFTFNKKYFITFPLIAYIIIGLFIGLLNTKFSFHNVIRDIFYHTNSLAVIILTLTIFTDKITKEQVFWSLLIVGTIMGFYTLHKIKEFKEMNNEIDYMNIRNISKKGYLINFISVISFLFIKKYKYITVPLSFFNLYMSIIAFSRVGIIMLSLLLIFMLTYYLLFSKRKYLIAISLFISCLFLVAFYLNTTYIQDNIERFLTHTNELNLNQDWTNSNNIFSSWRAYEVWLIINNFKKSNFLIKVFGNGFGSYIYIEDGIWLNDELFYEIPVFHNGYFGCLFKCGIVGVILYVSFLITLYVYSFKYIKNKKDLFLNLALISYIVLASYVVMGLFYKEVWFPLIFLVIYLIKYHMDDRDNLLKKDNNIESSLIEE